MKKNNFEQKYLQLKMKIEKIGFICNGSVLSVYKTCGNSKCICHKDKSKRHGPYNIWTKKIKGKTVTKLLTDEQAILCRECIKNMREIENILNQMKELSTDFILDYRKNRGKM